MSKLAVFVPGVPPMFDVPLATDKSYHIALPEGRQDNVLAQAFQTWLLEQVGKPL